MNDQNHITDPAQALLNIVHGDVSNIRVPHKSIISGKKMRNQTLRKFVDKFREVGKLDDKKLLDVIMALDEVVEKEMLTEDLLEQIRKNPEILSKLKKK